LPKFIFFKRVNLCRYAAVAAMLSVERVFIGGGGGGKNQDRPPSIASPEEEGMGDHVVLLRVYQAWQKGGQRRDFCDRHGLSDRGGGAVQV
jgi:ATP-dependent RNA helicase DHX8/PRP22